MPRKCLVKAEKRVRVTDETFSKWRLQRDSLGFTYDDEYAQYLLRVGESLQKINMLDKKEGSTSADADLELRAEEESHDVNRPAELETDDMVQSGDEAKSDNDNSGPPGVSQTSIKAFKRTLAPPKEAQNNDSDYSARKLDLGWCTAEYDRQQVLSGITDQKRFIAHLLNSHNQWCSTCRTSSATLTASTLAQDKSDFAASNPELKIPTSWESKKWFEDLNAHSNMSITSFLLHLLLIYSHWHSIPLPGGGELPRDVTRFARTATGELENVEDNQSECRTQGLEHDYALSAAGRPDEYDGSFSISRSKSDMMQENLAEPSNSTGYNSFLTGTSFVKKEVVDLADVFGLAQGNPESSQLYSEGPGTQSKAQMLTGHEATTGVPMDSDVLGHLGLKYTEGRQFCAGAATDGLPGQKNKIDPVTKHLHEVVERSVKDHTSCQYTTCSVKSGSQKLPKRKRGCPKLTDRPEKVAEKKSDQGKRYRKKKSESVEADNVEIACTLCPKIFMSALRHKYHMKKHIQSFHCSYCDFAIDPEVVIDPCERRTTMKEHRKSMHPEHFQKCLCDICGRGFADPKGLNLHRVDIHNLDIAALRKKCQKCDAEFPTRSGLVTHMGRFHPQNIPCTHNGCEKVFPTPAGLQTHIRCVHLKVRKHICKYEGCNARFVQAGHLKNHIRQVHLQLRNFECNFAGCTKVFFSEYNLRVHKRIHSNDKPLKCLYCDFRANQRNSMNWHMKKHATSVLGEGPPGL